MLIYFNIFAKKHAKLVNFMKIKLKNIFTVLLASLFFLFLGFYNNYPFVYPDTGTYIRSGIKCLIPVDRPIYYGLFIRHLSLLTSMWYVVFAQSIIISYLLFLIFKHFFIKNYRLYFLISVVVLTLTTGVSFHISQLMPDIFTSIAILSFFLLLIIKPFNKIDYIAVSIIFIYSIFTHNSHVYIILLILVFIILLFIIKKKFCKELFNLKRLLLVCGIYITAIILFPTCNYLLSGTFFYSNTSDFFLISKINDEGILTDYLNENCGKKNYVFCQYKDTLAWDLLWDMKSPLNRTGNWMDIKDECHAINSDILSTPKYSRSLILKTIPHTFKQFFHFSVGEPNYHEGYCTPAAIEIQKYYQQEIKEFYSNNQISNRLDFKFLNNIQLIIVFISFLIFLVFLSNKISPNTKILKFSIYFILLSLFTNAFVCSTFSVVIDRYQSRVVWLAPLFLLIILFNWYDFVKANRIKNEIKG
jgi:hypothetical protein